MNRRSMAEASTPTFGGGQRTAIAKDLARISSLKYFGFRQYMFVTSKVAYDCLLRDYRLGFPTICFVLLTVKPEVSRPNAAAD